MLATIRALPCGVHRGTVPYSCRTCRPCPAGASGWRNCGGGRSGRALARWSRYAAPSLCRRSPTRGRASGWCACCTRTGECCTAWLCAGEGSGVVEGTVVLVRDCNWAALVAPTLPAAHCHALTGRTKGSCMQQCCPGALLPAAVSMRRSWRRPRRAVATCFCMPRVQPFSCHATRLQCAGLWHPGHVPFRAGAALPQHQVCQNHFHWWAAPGPGGGVGARGMVAAACRCAAGWLGVGAVFLCVPILSVASTQ